MLYYEAQEAHIIHQLNQGRYEDDIAQGGYGKDKDLGGICQIAEYEGHTILAAVYYGGNAIGQDGYNLLSKWNLYYKDSQQQLNHKCLAYQLPVDALLVPGQKPANQEDHYNT